jgi:hypothetical protein
MKLLFLDVDGVLNNLEVLSACRSSDPLGDTHLKLLKILVAATDCNIVISSTWRLFPESLESLKIAFEEHEIPLWIGCTPVLQGVPRSQEILSWLKSNLSVDSIAVGIDDDEDIDIGEDHGLSVKFKPIKTCFDHGLTQEVVQEAIDWLNSWRKVP